MQTRTTIKGASKRLLKEINSIGTRSSSEVILYQENPHDILHWKAWIRGPPETPYDGGYFLLDIQVPESYPLNPPEVKFVTPIFHPNVLYKEGQICLDILKSSEAWTAVYTLQTVCHSIISLLAHPEPNSPLNCDCGNLLRCGDERGYRSMARMYTRLHASFTLPTIPGEGIGK
eukprot:TRINITY_DN3681_c0_g1_i2.p1 TRINITY_DN3681_c0_g1~~TRINITY_DN3681_c0_g1_i2.p1  ORF type:complete len:174 (+),score=30.15 TRINITY_DN3681_c0_g1_i2:187-708(+)